jgi:hypothetical protein
MPPETGTRLAARSAEEIMRRLLALSVAPEVREHELFRWLASLDSELGGRDRRKTTNRNWSEVIKALQERRFDEELVRDAFESLSAEFLTPILQRSYESAVSIGRKWKTAATRIKWAKSAKEPSNVAITIAANFGDVATGGDTIGRIGTALNEIFDKALKSAESSLLEARSEWADWTKKVGVIYEQLNLLRNQDLNWNSTEFLVRLLQSFMTIAMLEDPEKGPSSYMKPLLVMLASLRRDVYEHDYDRFLYLLGEAIRDSVYGDADQKKLDELKTRYGADNPFDRYGLRKRSADPELLRLLDENMLPSGRFSQYVNDWQSSFGRGGYSYVTPAASIHTDFEDVVETAAIWIDRKIKNYLIGNFSTSLEVQDVATDHLYDWLSVIAGNARARREDFDLFARFVTTVWQELQKQGYGFGAFTNDELRQFWEGRQKSGRKSR